MKKDDTTYLRHIQEAIRDTQGFIEEMSFDEFSKDKKTIAAVQRKLEIIGEAMSNISKDFLKEHANLPHTDAIGMRNIIIHEYFGVNEKVIWNTCQEDLPPLLQIIETILKEQR